MIQVEVTVFGQIVHATLLFPYLNGEDGRLAIAHALIGREQNLTHNATTLRARVRTIINRREYHLISTTRVNGVHIVDEGLHRLMHTTHRLVDGVLLGTLPTLQTFQRLLDIVHQRFFVQVFIALAIQVFQCFQLLDIRQAHVWCQIEIKGRNGLTTMHLVLTTLHRDTSQHRGRLNTLGRTRSTMTCHKAAVQDVVQRMLYAGQRLGGIIVLVVDVQIVMFHSVTTLTRQQIVVHERLGSLRGKLHHHASWRVGIHIGILTRYVVALDVDDVQEHVARLSLAGYRTLVTIGNILLSHILTT